MPTKDNLYIPMTHTFELRLLRRAHQLKQDELAHLLGVTPTMITRMEQGAKAQLADLEAMLGLEIIFGKSLSQILASLHAVVEDAVMRRAAELEKVWRTVNDAGCKAKLALLDDMMSRAKIAPDVA